MGRRKAAPSAAQAPLLLFECAGGRAGHGGALSCGTTASTSVPGEGYWLHPRGGDRGGGARWVPEWPPVLHGRQMIHHQTIK